MSYILTSLKSDEFNEYPEISATDLDGAVHRRNFVEVPQKQNINLMLDTDIIAWFKKNPAKSNFSHLSMRH